MSKVFRGLLVIALCAATTIDAAPQADSRKKVAPIGVTDITSAFGKTRVLVKITTRELDIGKPSDERPNRILSSCTYSRYPCSSVEYLEISVNGNGLFVARSVYADLADVGAMSLREKKKGQFVLSLNGGDASESYTVDVTFDENMVRERTFTSNEAKQIMQRTIYSASKSMDK